MRFSSLFPIATIICLQLSLGHTEDAAASDKHSEVSKDTSVSREKRASYDMMRLGRGLHMLRLGKRSDDYTEQEEEELEDILAYLQAINEQFPHNFPTYENYYPEEEVEVPAPRRFRRSAEKNVAPTEVIQIANVPPTESVPVDLKGEIEEEQLFPDDNLFLYDDGEDGIIQPKEGGDDEEKRSLGMLRLGKRQLSMLRLGKRSLGMLRLGKREDENEEDKRSLGMLRLGKRQLSMLRLGKRSLGMLRLGKRQDENLDDVYNEEEKRSMSMLRLGKRPMSMLRLGKRPMSMLRLGKRPMSMLRLGKRPMSMLRLGKRPMSMLRLGKRPMSMLRLGKREEEDKRSLGMLRLGKR
jgi:hypothetical protein